MRRTACRRGVHGGRRHLRWLQSALTAVSADRIPCSTPQRLKESAAEVLKGNQIIEKLQVRPRALAVN